MTIHETSNTRVGADAQAHANLQSNGNVRQASWHITVDDTEAIRSYPDSAQCWHAGPAGADSIAVEICVNSDGDYDAAFARAGAVVAGLRVAHGLARSDVHQHNHWTGKNCPSTMRAAERWQEFLNLTDPKENHMGSMVSPFEGRLTANHHTGGGYRGHRGMDIAPPRPGQTGKPVYAAFAGTVKEIHRTARHGNRNSTWAPQRTGNGGLIANPDGEGNGYNHVAFLPSLKVGDWVNAGELIGHNDTSGTQSGPHLHFEMWSDWRNAYSDYNPRLAFDAHGVKPGSAPALIVVPVAVVKPRPKPASKPTAKPAPSGNSKADNEAIQRALKAMGLYNGRIDGVDGNMQKASVKAFQKKHGLVQDGYWGPVAQSKYEALGRPTRPAAKKYTTVRRGSRSATVGRVQRALSGKGYNQQIVDNDFGAQTEANVRDWQRRKGLVVDGIAGSITQKSLGL